MYKYIINLFMKSDLCVLFKIYYLINLINYWFTTLVSSWDWQKMLFNQGY
jgi:hypothetical protein